MNRLPFRAAMLKPKVSQDMIPGFIAVPGFHPIDPFRAGMRRSPYTRQVVPAAFGLDRFVRLLIAVIWERISRIPGR